MRNEMQLIIPQLYLGPYKAATKSQRDNLASHGITHIVCIRDPQHRKFVNTNFPDDIKYLVLEFSDNSTINIIQYIAPFNEFVNEAMTSGGNVLVHGLNGISRSAALVVAYIMETQQLALSEAVKLVQSKRRYICSNRGFQQQLKDYEAIYTARLQTNMIQHESNPHGKKRTSDDMIS